MIDRFIIALLVCSIVVGPARAETIELGNFKTFAQGQYHAYPGMWALEHDDTLALGHKAVEGVDYISTITIDKSAFPNQSTISWRVPSKLLDLTGVYGYLQLAFGNYHGSRVPVPVQAAKIASIERLKVSLSYSYSGDNRFNLLNELYLMGDPTDLYSTLFEVGVFARASDEMMQYFNDSDQIGRYLDEQDRAWRVAKRPSPQGGDFIMLIPASGKDAAGEFDWVGIFSFLRNKGILKGDEWFTGIAAGVEPVAGAGQLRLDEFQVDYGVAD